MTTSDQGPLGPEHAAEVQPIDNRGLFDKFDVIRTDGQSEPGGKHRGCAYLVLDLVHDPVARQIARSAAASYAQLRPRFAAELLAQVDELNATDPIEGVEGPSGSWAEAAKRLREGGRG